MLLHRTNRPSDINAYIKTAAPDSLIGKSGDNWRHFLGRVANNPSLTTIRDLENAFLRFYGYTSWESFYAAFSFSGTPRNQGKQFLGGNSVPIPAHVLRDDFNDNSLNTSKWVKFEGGGATVTETNTQLEISYPASTSAATDGDITSFLPVYLKNSAVSLKVVQLPLNTTAANAELRLFINPSNWVRLLIEGPTLYAQKRVAGVNATVFSAAYNATNHAYWRIREANGTTYWDTSADGITWNNFTSLANPIDPSSLTVMIAGTTYQVETSPGKFIVDNVNI